MQNVVATVRALVVDAQQRLLLVQDKGLSWWYTPGGKIQYDDKDLITAVTREVYEETGLTVEIAGLAFVAEYTMPQKPRRFIDSYFYAQVIKGELQNNWQDLGESPDEENAVSKARFFTLAELQTTDVRPRYLRSGTWQTLQCQGYVGHEFQPTSDV